MRSTERVHLRWTGKGLVFRGGREDAPEITVDGDSTEGPSPMNTLLLGLAACMGSDVRHILGKSRVSVESLEVEVEGDRAPENPRRYERIRLLFRVGGPTVEDEPKLERAVELSRETYCSAIHSLRSDIDVEIRIERV